MNNNQKTLGVIGAIIVCALAITVVYGILCEDILDTDNNNFTITFEEYDDPANPTTSVKYYLGTEDITGKTVEFTKETPIRVVASSENQLISTIKLEYIPNSETVSLSHLYTTGVDSKLCEVDVNVRHIFNESILKATLSSSSSNDDILTVSTTFSIKGELTCTVGGQVITDGETIVLDHDEPVLISSKKTGHIWYSASWNSGLSTTVDEYPVKNITGYIYNGFFGDSSGTVRIWFTDE